MKNLSVYSIIVNKNKYKQTLINKWTKLNNDINTRTYSIHTIQLTTKMGTNAIEYELSKEISVYSACFFWKKCDS